MKIRLFRVLVHCGDWLLSIASLLVVFCCTSCEQSGGIDLPDINAQSFSYEEIVNKKNELERKKVTLEIENRS